MPEPVKEQITKAIKEDKGSVSPRVAVGIGAAGLLAAGIGLAVATRGEPTPTQPPATETPSAAAASPTPKETPIPTVVKTPEATPTKTPEVKPVPCRVLPEQYCSQSERVKVTTNGLTVEYIGINNLPPDTPIFARKNGFLDKTKEGQPFSGFRAVVRDNIGGTTYRGDLRFDNLLSKDVKEGEIIGYIGSTEARNFGYKLLVTITKRTDQGPVVDEATLKELFPEAYEKPVKSFDGGQAQSVPTISHASASPSPK